jgi:heat shock protein HslJ
MVAAIGVALLALGTLSGCVPSGPSQSDPRLEGTWFLASGSDSGHDLAVGAQVISLTISDSAHTGGDEPCSTYSATVTGGIGVIYVRPQRTSGTRDSCETTALNQLQQLYFTALSASQFATIDQSALVLTSSKSNLVFLRAAPEAVANMHNTNWLLYSIATEVPTVTAKTHLDPVHLTFNKGDTLTLKSPCMSVRAAYQLEGENFAVSHGVGSLLISTLCTPADRRLSSNVLTLFDSPLLLNVSSDGKFAVPMMVITNLSDNLNIVFRADK